MINIIHKFGSYISYTCHKFLRIRMTLLLFAAASTMFAAGCVANLDLDREASNITTPRYMPSESETTATSSLDSSESTSEYIDGLATEPVVTTVTATEVSSTTATETSVVTETEPKRTSATTVTAATTVTTTPATTVTTTEKTTVAAASATTKASKDENASGLDVHLADDDDYYFRNALTGDYAKIYDGIYNGLFNRADVFTVKYVDYDTLYDIFSMVTHDHPEIFWTDGGYTYTYDYINCEISPTYSFSKSDILKIQEQIDENISEILQELYQMDSEYEIAKAVYEYLIDTVEYVWDSPNNQNIISSLVNGESVCSGYAKAAQYLMQLCGLQVIRVDGNVIDSGSHTWLIVRIDGKYYQYDVTFGDRVFSDPSSNPDQLDYDYSYLCTTDEIMLRDRDVDKTFVKLPECNSNDYNYYVLNDSYYEEGESNVEADMADSISHGERVWSAQFESESDYLTVKAKVENGLYHDTLIKNYTFKPDTMVVTWYTCDDYTYSITCWRE